MLNATINTFDNLRKLSEKPWFYPAALLLIGFVTYCYALPSLGYYWDDWEIVMFNELDPSLQFDFYSTDRPFPWTYQIIHSLVGSDPVGWHVVTLLIRWAGVLIFTHALILLWPRYENHFYWLGTLILLYPGFLQQSQSATKARHIMTFLLFALSIYLMVLAIRRPQWRRILFPLSWLATFAHLFTTEYFSGLEFVRPLFLWLLLSAENEPRGKTLRRTAGLYLPYLAITAFYFWCRLFYFPVLFRTTARIGEIGSTLQGLQESTTVTFLSLLDRALSDFVYLLLQVWLNAILEFEGFSFQSRVAWFVFAVGIILAVVFAFFYQIREKEKAEPVSPSTIFILGFSMFVMGAIPIWLIGKDISSGGWADRFALAPLLGACLMVLALILWFVRPAAHRAVLAFLMAFSIAAQMWVVNAYRRDWAIQRDFYWQLYWRAPALQTGTAVFSFEQPSPTVTHYADAGYALNVLYHYETMDGTLPYWYFPRRFHFDYQPNDPFRYQLRIFNFEGNTSQGIGLVHQEQNSCLRVLDDVYALDPLIADGRNVLLNVSDPSFIIPDESAPPPDPEIFGSEPARDWCYYFQKGDLARQIQDWEKAIALFREAQRNELRPRYGVEYIPFIEAYVQTGDWQQAYELTRAAYKTNAGLRTILCATWSRLGQLPSADGAVVRQANEFLSCSG
jgi:tetratricopeptide (TPR) repeat protein